MSTIASTPERGYQKHAWLLLFVLGILFSLSSLFIVFTGGFDMSDFEASTDTNWDEFSESQPEVAEYLVRLERLSSAGFAGFAFFATALAWTSYRGRKQYAWYIMWLFPIFLGGATAIFLSADATGLGSFYGGAAVLAVLGLLLSYRAFFPK